MFIEENVSVICFYNAGYFFKEKQIEIEKQVYFFKYYIGDMWIQSSLFQYHLERKYEYVNEILEA